MIDFNNASFVKLSPTNDNAFLSLISPMFVDGEEVIGTYKGIRDGVVFTNKRIITINVQGITGKKKDFTSLPYSKIQAYSVETAGTFDLESELDMYYSGIGQIRFEFRGSSDIIEIARTIAMYALK